MNSEIKLYPLVSIVIPAKNEEDNIARCLEGIQSLEYPKSKFEVIVVDNGSSDKTVDIAKNMGAQIYILPDVTISALRNYGLKKSSGDYIAFIDADCIPNVQWLSLAVNTMIAHNDVSVVGGILTTEEGESRYWIEEYWLEYLNSKYRNNINFVKTISSFCFVITKKIMEDIGGFNERLITCEDSDLGYRISKAGAKIIINRDIKTIHLRNAKTTVQFFKRQLWQGRSNLAGFFSHGVIFNELHSVLIPIMYLFLVIFLPLTFLFKSMNYAGWIIAISLVGLPIIITLKSPIARHKKKFLGYVYLWFLYLMARGSGMLIKITQWKA